MKYLLVILLFVGCAPEIRRYHHIVDSIGGCNSDGLCGVKLRDGTVLADVPQPVVGTFPDCSDLENCREISQ